MEDEFENKHVSQCIELKAEISQLKGIIEKYENDRELAANYGAKLLEINQQLRNELEEQRSGFNEIATDLEHKNGLLQNQVKSMKLSLEEADGHRTLQDKRHQCKLEEVEEQLTKQLHTINKKIELLQQEKREHLLNISQMKDENKMLSDALEERTTISNNKSTLNDSVDEFEKIEIQLKIAELNDANFKLEKSKQEIGHERDRYIFSVKKLEEQITNLTADLEASQCQGSGWYNHLQKTRDELLETKTNLDLANSELNSVGYSKRGNSLFSEVEDKRQLILRKYTALERKHQALVKSHSFLHQQLGDMKQQMLSILQRGSGKAEREKIASLEDALAICQGEADTMAVKLKRLQDSRTENDNFVRQTISSHINTQQGHPSDVIVEFLRRQLEDARIENKKLIKELDVEGLSRLAQNEKLAETEENLYKMMRKSEKQKCYAIKLGLKIDELKKNLEKAKTMPGQQKTEEVTAAAATACNLTQQKSLPSLPRSIARKYAKEQQILTSKSQMQQDSDGGIDSVLCQPINSKDETLMTLERSTDVKQNQIGACEDALHVSYLDNSWKQPEKLESEQQPAIISPQQPSIQKSEDRLQRKRLVTFNDSVCEIDHPLPNNENENANVFQKDKPKDNKSKMAKTVFVTKESKAQQQQQCTQQ